MMRGLLLSLVMLTAGAAAEPARVLHYQVSEPGLEPYPSRVLVTERWLRMDDALDEGDYLLFDRERLRIYSVTHSDRTVFEIPPRPVALEPPIALAREAERVEMPQAPPSIAGRPPQYHRLYVNSKRCRDLVAVPGLLEPAVVALREYRRVLAGEQARVLPMVPAEMHEPCDLALNVFHSDWPLSFGLPIQVMDPNGGGRVLVDFEESREVAPALFTLPEGYRHYSAEEVGAL